MITCPGCGAELLTAETACSRCGAASQSRTSNLIGKTIADKYVIEAHLGSGGMCDVYRARHRVMGKQFALKILKPELAADPKIAERFEQEARAVSLIQHPHAISIVDYGHSESGIHFIVMELVVGLTLGDLLRRGGPLSLSRSAAILRQVCNALDSAHSVGIIHRDIKPDNIILAEYDGSDWVKVVDFGVAKIQEDVNRRAQLTGANIIVGTPRYMSPEQCEERPVDARCDIYSLGVVLYEMLSGEAPFEGNSSMRLLMAHASEPPPPLREKRPDLSPDIERVVMRALEKDPARRPQTASGFAASFERAAGTAQAGSAILDRSSPFSRISVPIGEQEETEPILDDEQTLVRPRQRTPVETYGLRAGSEASANESRHADPGSITPDEPADWARATPVETVAPRRASVVYRDHSGEYRSGNGWGWALGVIALMIVAAAAAYVLFGDRLLGRSATGDTVFEAQQAVTDAMARIDSLPQEHPLRAYLPQLAQWQGELRAYSEVGQYNNEVLNRAEQYRQKAEQIAGQARVAAQSARPVPPVNNSNSGAQQRDRMAGEGTPGEQAEPEDEDSTEEETVNRNTNSNTSKPRRADPPVLDPVKPVPPPQQPTNSNRPKPGADSAESAVSH